MNIAVRKTMQGLLLVVYIVACGEIMLRALSSFTYIYNVEMLNYAKELKVKSAIPGISHEHRPNAGASLMGVDITLNSLGHRSAELRNPKTADERRIHVLGSSIALGWGVAEEEALPSVIADMFNRQISPKTGLNYVAINAGIGNYNTFYQVEKFKRQVAATDPDMVVLQYYINDAEPNPGGEDSPILRYSVLAAFVYQHIKVIAAVSKISLADHYTALYVDGAPGWERAKKSIQELKKICDQRGIQLAALIVPELHNLSPDGPYPPLYAKIRETFAVYGIETIDTFDPVRRGFAENTVGAWVSADDPHPSAKAHRIMAEETFRALSMRRF